MLVVTQPDQVKRTFRRFTAHEPVKAAFGENLIHRANPVRPFRMSRRCQMVEACPVRQKKGCHAMVRRERAQDEAII
jgi:hypothetical protein